MTALPVTADDVVAAHRRIDGVVVRTPVVPPTALRRHLGAEVLLKLEGVQETGSFKVRGAASVLLGLDAGSARRGRVRGGGRRRVQSDALRVATNWSRNGASPWCTRSTTRS